MKRVFITLLLSAALLQSQTNRTIDLKEFHRSRHAELKAQFVPADFNPEIPYASLVRNLSLLASRLNQRTLSVAGSPIFHSHKSEMPENLRGRLEWVVDDSQDDVVGKSQLTITARTYNSFGKAIDLFISHLVVLPVGSSFQACAVPGPKLGDLCLYHEHSASLAVLVLRNNVVLDLHSAGPMRNARNRGQRIDTTIPLRPDPGVKSRAWELMREMDNTILELSGNAR